MRISFGLWGVYPATDWLSQSSKRVGAMRASLPGVRECRRALCRSSGRGRRPSRCGGRCSRGERAGRARRAGTARDRPARRCRSPASLTATSASAAATSSADSGWTNTGARRTAVAVDARVGDASDELEELRCAEDRVRDGARLHRLLLRELRTEIAAIRESVGADDRQRDVVPHAGGRFRGQDVPRRGLEEVQHRRVVPDGRVRHVDDDLGTLERVGQPLARERVDAGVRRRRERLVAVLRAVFSTSFEPMRPVPPMTTIFIIVSFRSCDPTHHPRAGRLVVLGRGSRPGVPLESANTLAWVASHADTSRRLARQESVLGRAAPRPYPSEQRRDERRADGAVRIRRHASPVTSPLLAAGCSVVNWLARLATRAGVSADASAVRPRDPGSITTPDPVRSTHKAPPTIVEPAAERKEDEMSTTVPPTPITEHELEQVERANTTTGQSERELGRSRRRTRRQHPGRLHPRPLAAAEQLGQLGGLLRAGRLRAADAGLARRSGKRLKRPGRTRTSSPRRP